MGKRRWTWLWYTYGLLVAAVLGYFLFGLVIQVSDSFGNLLAVQTPTLGELVRDQFSQRAYLRPLLWAQLKIVYELSGGALLSLVPRHSRRPGPAAHRVVRTSACDRGRRSTRALVPLSLAVLIGAHTFVPMVREAFPINGFLTMAVCCVAVASLALRERSHWVLGLLAIALFVAIGAHRRVGGSRLGDLCGRLCARRARPLAPRGAGDDRLPGGLTSSVRTFVISTSGRPRSWSGRRASAPRSSSRPI